MLLAAERRCSRAVHHIRPRDREREKEKGCMECTVLLHCQLPAGTTPLPLPPPPPPPPPAPAGAPTQECAVVLMCAGQRTLQMSQ